MSTLKNNFSWSNAALLAVVIALVAYQTFANRPQSAGTDQAPRIATFDLKRTFDSLDQKKAADVAIDKTANDLKAEGDRQAKAIKQMEADLKDFPPGTPKHQELMDKWSLASQEYRAYIEFCEFKVRTERARTLRQIYMTIKRDVEQLATERRYAVVFADDSIPEIPAGTDEVVEREISARRMIYTSPDVDITEALISHMNKVYQAGNASASDAPAPAPPRSPSTKSP